MSQLNAEEKKRRAELEAEQSRELNREYQAFLRSPSYLSALRFDSGQRDLAFIDGPEVVCGLSMRQITSLDLLVHFQLACPFLSDGFLSGKRKATDSLPDSIDEDWPEKNILIPASAIATFLWVQSESFVPQDGFIARMIWKSFMRKCRKLRYSEAVESIRAFMDDALCDRPGGSKSDGSPVSSWIAGAVHMVASKYHWTEEEILVLPVRRLFQYERCILASMGERAALFNRADALRADWLRDVNKRMENQRKELQ